MGATTASPQPTIDSVLRDPRLVESVLAQDAPRRVLGLSIAWLVAVGLGLVVIVVIVALLGTH
jgi:hypothetical protein